MNKLIQLHEEIDARVNAIRETHTDWQCKMGCDGCCKRLAEIPYLTHSEWDLLRTGLMNLSAEIREEITQTVAELSTQFVVCPMLDKSQGICRVYNYRPIACRTYGYYVQHDKGLYCNDILGRVSSGELDEVVWGNQNTIDRQLNHLGDSKTLTEWFADWI
jgi:Fe-S-cluster containining protein